MDIENILTVEDVARILQVKAITVREMFRKKRLRAFKMGKSWRTTKQMLEEDLVELAAKPQLEESSATPPRRRGRPRKAETAASAPQAASVVEAAPLEAPPVEPKKRAARQAQPAAKDDDPDDTQQFLF